MMNLFVNKECWARLLFSTPFNRSRGKLKWLFSKKILIFFFPFCCFSASACEIFFLTVLYQYWLVYGNASVHKSGTKLVFMDDSILSLLLSSTATVFLLFLL